MIAWRAAAGAALVMASAAVTWILLPPTPERPEAVAPLMAALDTDGDGLIGPLEYGLFGAGHAPFALYDLDGDAQIEMWELEIGLWAVDPLWIYAAPGQAN